MPRTTVVFETPAFNTTESKSYFLNPSCFGDDVLRWVIRAFRGRGISTADDPEQEDFGWFLRFDIDGREHCLVLGFRPGDSPPNGQWIATVERSRGLLGSILGRRRVGISQAALKLVHDTILTMPGVSAISWHHEDRFRAGIENEGARTPLPAGLAPGEFGDFVYRGEAICFGTLMRLAGRTVYVDLRRDRLLEERKQAARALVAQADHLAAAFEAFKLDEARRRPGSADVISKLEIEMITLHHRSDAGIGEVYFTDESGNDQWSCLLKDGRFSELLMET